MCASRTLLMVEVFISFAVVDCDGNCNVGGTDVVIIIIVSSLLSRL